MLSRRDFLSMTALSGAAAVGGLDGLARPMPAIPAREGYRLLVFATNWGYAGSWESFASKIRDLGYDGAELWYPADPASRQEIETVFSAHGLKLGFLVGSGERDFRKHLEQFRTNLEGAASLNPVYINCHSGRDHFHPDQNAKFIELTDAVFRRSGVPVYHETHRSRILYSAPVARRFIEKHPGLRITFDVSHWCNVHESLLADQEDTIAMTLERVDHVHARIGHPEGPQVNDPRAPEWKEAVDAHFAWWDSVVERKKREGKLMTFLTEFGPVDYMPALPYTRQPLADQWSINKHMLDILRKRYT